MAGSRDHTPRVDAQKGRFGSDCLEKAVQEGSHPAGSPSHLSDPVGSAGLDSKIEVLENPGPRKGLASLEQGKQWGGVR